MKKPEWPKTIIVHALKACTVSKEIRDIFTRIDHSKWPNTTFSIPNVFLEIKGCPFRDQYGRWMDITISCYKSKCIPVCIIADKTFSKKIGEKVFKKLDSSKLPVEAFEEYGHVKAEYWPMATASRFDSGGRVYSKGEKSSR
jgi:hypothetical protein